MRDTGWKDETFLAGDGENYGSLVRRIGDAAILRVGANGDWWGVYLSQEEQAIGDAVGVPEAKRAAETALRAICKDTLACLGDEP